MPKKTKPKRGPGRPPKTIAKNVSANLSAAEERRYEQQRQQLLDWIEAQKNTATFHKLISPEIAVTTAGVRYDSIYYRRLIADPLIVAAIEYVRTCEYSATIERLRTFATGASPNPKFMDMYLRILSPKEDLARLSGGAKLSDVSQLTIDNRKQITIQTPDIEKTDKHRKQLPDIQEAEIIEETETEKKEE